MILIDDFLNDILKLIFLNSMILNLKKNTEQKVNLHMFVNVLIHT